MPPSRRPKYTGETTGNIETTEECKMAPNQQPVEEEIGDEISEKKILSHGQSHFAILKQVSTYVDR